MKDLVERLRGYRRDRSGYAEYCHQAADELDRMREALEYIATGGENWDDCVRKARAAIKAAKGEA